MGNVIEFPKARVESFEKAVEYFQSAYLKAELSPEQVLLAINELEPFIKESFPRKEFVFDLVLNRSNN